MITTAPLFFVGSAPTIALDPLHFAATTLALQEGWRTGSTLLSIVLGMLALWTLQALSS